MNKELIQDLNTVYNGLNEDLDESKILLRNIIDKLEKAITVTPCYKGEAEQSPSVRARALKWFNSLGLEQQFYKTIECNHLITGDNTRHPSTLTGLEIEKIYKHVHSL